jgi:hypothetical protein
MPYYKVKSRIDKKEVIIIEESVVPDVDVDYRIIRPLRDDGTFVIETEKEIDAELVKDDDPIVKSHLEWWERSPKCKPEMIAATEVKI